MRKAIITALLVVPALFVASLVGPGRAEAGTLYVGPGETHTTIQSAIDAASDGDTIVAFATAAKNPGLFEFRPGTDVAFRGIGDESARSIEVVRKQMAQSMSDRPSDQKAEKVITITTVGE